MFDQVPEHARPKWAKDAEATAEQWVSWFSGMPLDIQVKVFDSMLTRMRHDTHCFMNDHVGRIEELRAEVIRLSAIIEQHGVGDPW